MFDYAMKAIIPCALIGIFAVHTMGIQYKTESMELNMSHGYVKLALDVKCGYVDYEMLEKHFEHIDIDRLKRTVDFLKGNPNCQTNKKPQN